MSYVSHPEYQPLSRRERAIEASDLADRIDGVLRRMGSMAVHLSGSSSRECTSYSRSWEYDISPDHPENFSPGRVLIDVVYEKTRSMQLGHYAVVVNWIIHGEPETDSYQRCYSIEELATDAQMTINEHQIWSSDLEQPTRRFVDRPMSDYDLDELDILLDELDQVDSRANLAME